MTDTDDTSTATIAAYEAVQNIASVYNSDTMTVNKLVATGDITATGTIDCDGNVSMGSDATVSGKMSSDTISVGGTTGLGFKMFTVTLQNSGTSTDTVTAKITDSSGNAIGDDYICMTVGDYAYAGQYSTVGQYEYKRGIHCYYDSSNGYWVVQCSVKVVSSVYNPFEVKVHVLAIPKNLFDQEGGTDSLIF